ncbi:cellulose-binding protein [Merismopedia glauca]|uniref:Cellulose-binding protein n=1 Tax=Merismopedia glauca CCAP 1448/3 TaxID=1296344 RepID=A0A2T1BYG3_9CYAN|nr:cellulose-binding protein [Merismopedia glauca]PSB00938.1 cellulose-binding protein [Merismopedia glauca CCAP 1448/3]
MKNKFFIQLYWLLFFHLSFLAASQIISKPLPARAVGNNTASPVGINLGGITYYSTDFPFINAFKNADKWRTVCVNTDPGCTGSQFTKEENLLQVDRNGWVKSLPTREDSPIYTRVRTFLFADVGNRYPGGQYVVLYKGEGKFSYGGAAQLIQTQLGRDIINVDSTTGRKIWIDIVSTDPQKNGNYIRDIILVKAEDEGKVNTQIFRPQYLDKLRGFQVIRFMDWMNINGSLEKFWDKRPLPASATYTKGSAPIEVMVSLSNKINASPWFNMPHMADNNYVTNFANLVKANLKSNLKVYVEYSNEVWNYSFPQGTWVEQQAIQEWPASQYPQSAWIKRLNWHGKRTAEVCEIWKNVFADRPKSVVCVLGSQGANTWASIQSLDCPLWVNRPCYNHKIDALGMGAYFGHYIGLPDNQERISSWSVDQLFQEINSGGQVSNSVPGGALADVKTKILANFQIAGQRNLKLFAYEGGQHLTGVGAVANNNNITNLFITANRDPRMYDAYTTLLNYWKYNGGSLFMHFNYVNPSSKWGSWGLLEHIDDQTSPKYQAVKDFIRNNP